MDDTISLETLSRADKQQNQASNMQSTRASCSNPAGHSGLARSTLQSEGFSLLQSFTFNSGIPSYLVQSTAFETTRSASIKK